MASTAVPASAKITPTASVTPRNGVGAASRLARCEIASTIQDLAFDYLDAPVKRVGAKNGIAPQSHILEAAFLPNVNDILAAANSIL